MNRDLVDRVFYTFSFILAGCLTAFVVCLTIAVCKHILIFGIK
jgi:hypothetical protein